MFYSIILFLVKNQRTIAAGWIIEI
jgi:hypothetical protein